MITRHEGMLALLRRDASNPRGVGFVWFALIAMPVLLFSAGLSVDLTRIIVAGREASNLTSAAAIAGAYEFETGEAYLNPGRARAEALATWEMGSSSANGDRNNAVALLDDSQTKLEISFDNLTQPTEVIVTTNYSIDGLLFTGFFGADNNVDGSVEKTAKVCIPGDNDFTEGFCTRPR